MSAETWAGISNLTIPTATVVYVFALVAHTVEWAGSRTVAKASPAAVHAGSGGPAVVPAELTEEPVSWRAEAAGRVGLLLTWLAFLLHATGVVTRGLSAGRVPWGNMYEFSISASLAVAIVYLAFERRYKLRWLGLGVTAVIGAVLGLAVLALYVPAGPLVPALDSYWLVIHVSAAAIAGGAFTVGAMASILYVVKSRAEQRALTGEAMPGPLRRLPASDAIDAVAYKVHAFAFPLWTFGVLVAGPIWAEHAWGRYWNWDPKEVWSFVVWVIYAAYLHARATAGWRGRKAALVAVVGWLAFLFNFVGVNLLISGLHSYAGI
jgi:cytochrome c-type biogenesis protein CcsB